jgi:hypothetical protein
MRATSRARREPPQVLLRLREVRPASMYVDVIGVGWHRTVSVLTDGSRPLYPHPLTDTGETTGDEHLDRAIVEFVQQRMLITRAGRWPR